MKSLHIFDSENSGGAARGALHIHRCLVDHGTAHGITSQIRVVSQQSDTPNVICVRSNAFARIWSRIQYRLSQQSRRNFVTSNPTAHSIAWPRTGLGTELNKLYQKGQIDLVHLHWLGDSTLSIEEIGRLSMPVVWTLHDQWAFCGSEHYTSPPLPGENTSRDDRFIKDYTSNSRPLNESGHDLNRSTWLRKRKAWLQPLKSSVLATG